jgi:glycerate kinase
MRVLIAFDKFKDSLTAPEACEIAAKALHEKQPDWQISQCPLTDGGEGFANILTRASHGDVHQHTVTGPRGTPVDASFGIVTLRNIPTAARSLLGLPTGIADTASIALIEMATASGLALLNEKERDPWHTTSYGTGELINRSIELGAEAILLGVGGSATNDLGLGTLNALGLSFFDSDGAAISPPIPNTWAQIDTLTGTLPANMPPIRIACDVDNPLLGPNGAATIYGPQKGLLAADLPRMEEASARLAALLCDHQGKPRATMNTPGAGAAGGIAFGMRTAAEAQLLPGADFVAAWLDVESHLAEADIVITGEGCFDDSSLNGKGPGALTARAIELAKDTHVFAGQIALTSAPENLHLHAITPAEMSLPEALRDASRLLTSAINDKF